LKKRPAVAEGMSIELHPGAEMFYQRALTSMTRP
jgi:hypothetical protein